MHAACLRSAAHPSVPLHFLDLPKATKARNVPCSVPLARSGCVLGLEDLIGESPPVPNSEAEFFARVEGHVDRLAEPTDPTGESSADLDAADPRRADRLPAAAERSQEGFSRWGVHEPRFHPAGMVLRRRQMCSRSSTSTIGIGDDPERTLTGEADHLR